ncbi:acetoacetate decarboxylase family protein [Gloeothece verrucosa]|uniref:Acetoacetate decarboxylase n=1 Tax=Gloeothece verrucosa (strain PCC 7822) TaxID=497965 RepID=E0U746_GLOV7|nr:acetoacetate decarboxylase family protein [Gloeothece verrucosa]ADN17202.1 Acetoacetate decarboxylase [Gloeothece verrucosa PCC 7822]
MTYPLAPWTLEGYAFLSVYLVDIDVSRSFIPSELEIISVWPGKTLGGVYFANYQGGSVLEYNELIVVPAFVRYQEKVGSIISHIYVDHQDSVSGGREIWGLPKELAQFTWDNQGVSISQNHRQLCHFRHQKGFFNLSTGWRQQLSGESFGGLETDLLYFSSTFKSHIGLVEGHLEIPPQSPFYQLKLSQPMLTLQLSQLSLMVNPPTIVGQKSI